jgi:hypothetical protein
MTAIDHLDKSTSVQACTFFTYTISISSDCLMEVALMFFYSNIIWSTQKQIEIIDSDDDDGNLFLYICIPVQLRKRQDN